METVLDLRLAGGGDRGFELAGRQWRQEGLGPVGDGFL